ncbi:UBX11 protein, partial [Amia calva]|nr:UBX11 protein [Amia calva]
MIWIVLYFSTAPAPSSVGHAEGRDFQVNFDLVLENVRDLNVLAGEGESHVERVAGGARLARSSAIPLSLFRNGIVMFEGPFRPYEEPHTRVNTHVCTPTPTPVVVADVNPPACPQQCVQDLMDGYFPSELQTRFPDGVPFEVRDRRDEVYRQSRRWEEFPGEGRMVGGVPETGHAAGPRLSVEQFLNRLPKAVIKEGKVIDIRGSIRDNLQVRPRTEQPGDPGSFKIGRTLFLSVCEKKTCDMSRGAASCPCRAAQVHQRQPAAVCMWSAVKSCKAGSVRQVGLVPGRGVAAGSVPSPRRSSVSTSSAPGTNKFCSWSGRDVTAQKMTSSSSSSAVKQGRDRFVDS